MEYFKPARGVLLLDSPVRPCAFPPHRQCPQLPYPIDIAHWFVLVGSLMLARGLWGSTIARLPFTSASIYLVIGVVPGPAVLGVFAFETLRAAP